MAGPVRKLFSETVGVVGWTELKGELAGFADGVVAERVDADRGRRRGHKGRSVSSWGTWVMAEPPLELGLLVKEQVWWGKR